jgi:ATP-binding cassette subfamily B protein
LVSQDVYLFHGTIRENIAYGMGDLPLEEVRKAAQIAQLDEFIESLPAKYETLIGERGLKLSGGQRQRLSIARAVLKNAPVIIMDEATSSVDTETERAIQRQIEAFTSGRTALLIAHRLSTLRQANRILVLDQGRVAEVGTHEELLLKGGIYADLWRVQIGEMGV